MSNLQTLSEKALSILIIAGFFWFAFRDSKEGKLKDWIRNFFGGEE